MLEIAVMMASNSGFTFVVVLSVIGADCVKVGA